jgi:hypothetical protein
MATTIKLKNGSGAPTAGDLVQGEPAFDFTNNRLYSENAGGTVVEIGTNPSVLTTTTGTFSGNVGVGVTPSAWNSAIQSVDVHNGSLLAGSRSLEMATNTYYTAGGSWVYKTTDEASRYAQAGDGTHKWYSAVSGTAGAAITWSQDMTLDASGNLLAGSDNTQTLGGASNRWSVVYAGTGTINTSDAREKTEVIKLTADELEASKQLSREVGTYKWLSVVAEKGDSARKHIGLTVQRAIEIMISCNLIPMEYGFICYDEWEDVFVDHPAIEAADVTEEAPAVEAKAAWTEQTQVAGDRYGFRYDELLAFIAAGFNARLDAAGI